MKKYFTLLFPVIFLLFLNNTLAQGGGHHSYRDTYHSSKSSSFTYYSPRISSYSYHVPKISSQTNHSYSHKSTYKSGSTTFISGEHYKKSGLPKVERSSSEKEKFLKSQGYKKVPPGYEVDHIKPLSEGGADNPSNMQLLTKQQHKQKTANERKK
jgi:5-methylcytosine-specific restriction endonuclease McrA